MRWRRRHRVPSVPAPARSRTFVGRDREVEALDAVVRSAAGGQVGILLIEGVQGMGKRTLLAAVRSDLSRELAEMGVVEVYCYQATGSQDPFGPLAEALQVLGQHERRDVAREALDVIREHGPDLLALVPGIGSSLSAAAKLGAGIVGRALSRGEAQARWESLPFQFERTIVALAASFHPLVLVIKEAQWIDERSAEVLHRLARHQEECRLAVVLSSTPVPDEHPLRALQREGEGAARAMELKPLGVEDIGRYVVARYGLPLSPELAPWLLKMSDGKPLYVEDYLDLLEEEGVIRVSDGRPELIGDLSLVQRRLPGDVADILRQRVGRLDDESRQLLQLAAVIGPQFLSATLADLFEEKEELILVARLEEIERQHRLVSFTSVERVDGKRSALYVFESGTHPTVYETVSRYRRLVLHRRIAESLDRFVEIEAAHSQLPRKWVLEIARHYRDAEEPLLAARRYVVAARSAFADGGFKEVAGTCREALALVRDLPEGVEEHDRLRAEVIELLLDASAEAWQPGDQPDGGKGLIDLVDEAEQAASRVGDPSLQARLKYARGRIVFWTGRLDDSIAVMREALDLARGAGDRLVELMVMSDLGHHLDSLDLGEGRKMVRAAYELYRAGPIEVEDGRGTRLLERYGSRLKQRIGVADFDLGRYGEAERWLSESVNELRHLEAWDDLAWSENFIGQLWTATGKFQQARDALEQAVKLSRASGSASTAYHLALLGKLYLEWDGQVAKAADPVEEGARMVPSSEMNDVGLLIQTVRAEFLLARAQDQDLDEARALLRHVIEEADRMGSQRAAISGRSLLARAALRGGDLQEGLNESVRAVEMLQSRKPKWFVPTVRSEEVLFTHHEVLAAANGGAAEPYLRLAVQILNDKALSLPNPEDQRVFLERVGLSGRISAAARELAPA